MERNQKFWEKADTGLDRESDYLLELKGALNEIFIS